MHFSGYNVSEVEWRTQRSRPRIKKKRGQGLTFRGQSLSRPSTGMIKAKAKDQGQNFSKLWWANFS